MFVDGCRVEGGERWGACCVGERTRSKRGCGGTADRAQWGYAGGDTGAVVSEVPRAMTLPTRAFIRWITCAHAADARANSRNV